MSEILSREQVELYLKNTVEADGFDIDINLAKSHLVLLDENERLRKLHKAEIKKLHKEFGCELRDPYGTIWEQSARDNEENVRLKEAINLMVLVGGYIKVSDENIASTRELVHGQVFCDYDLEGRLVGVEVLR